MTNLHNSELKPTLSVVGGNSSGVAGKFNNKFQKPTGKFIKKEDDKNEDKKFDNSQQKTSTEKPDWSKFKQDKKDLKLKRKGTKDLFEVTAQAKVLYEQLKWLVIKHVAFTYLAISMS